MIVQKAEKFYEYRSLRTEDGTVKTYYIGTLSPHEVQRYREYQQQKHQHRQWSLMLAHATAEVREETATIRRLVTRLLNHEGWTLRRGELRRLPSTNPTQEGEKRPMQQPMTQTRDDRTMVNKTTSRELDAMTNLKDYLPLPSTLQTGIFHTLFVYLADGGDYQPHLLR